MDNKSYLLTIAIPTYNGSKTICRVLDLLIPQLSDEVELIILDNCSTDETPLIINSYQKKCNCIKYFRNQQNIGADGNFLECLKLASGKYVYLLSDDDVLIEGTLLRLRNFLSLPYEFGLVYLGTANFYGKYDFNSLKYPIKLALENIITKDKQLFMKYASHYWGFVSSFVVLKKRFENINNPEQFFGSYWLQAYIYILCSSGEDTYLGVLSGPCVGAGVYITQSNFDTSYVDGISYRKMLEFAVDNGYNKRQLKRLFVKRFALLARHGIVKEKATGNKRIDKKQLFSNSYRYLSFWLFVYPFLLVPRFICKWYFWKYRKKKGEESKLITNRSGDVSS